MSRLILSSYGARRRNRTWPLLLIAATLAGCGRDNVKVYRLSNDDSSSAAPPPNATATAVPDQSGNNAAQPQLQWTLPAGWTQVAPGEMSIASFKVSGPNGAEADVSVVPLPGMAGGDTANVNRWRGQMGLAAATADELQKMAEAVQVGDQSATLYDLVGSDNAKRILGVIQQRSGTTWFFKMTGDATLVEQQKPQFTAFLKSLTFTAASQSAALPPGHPDIGGADQNAPMMPADSTGAGKPAWTVPTAWQAVPASQFLLAEYSIAGANGTKAEVNVAELNGSGGGVLANVNRWRGQIGLDPVDETGLAKVTTTLNVAGGQATLVDMTGNDMSGQSTRLVAAIVPMDDQTWFYKLAGDAQVVAGQKDAFTKFVQTARYSNAP
ncbi:MAG TPA: hypothetical protein VN784_09450 [Candidatus Limnocylindrales bacterium]|nr:hypothetical protein [Candidatus Limnocylindrales bacterium]